MDNVPSFKSIAYRRAYEQGKRQGFAKGLAESLIETLAGSLAESLGGVLEHVLAEEFLHCLERGRAHGMRSTLSEMVLLNFGEGVSEEFLKIIEPIDSPTVLRELVKTVVWTKEDETLLKRVRAKAAEAAEAKDESPSKDAKTN